MAEIRMIVIMEETSMQKIIEILIENDLDRSSEPKE